MRIIHDAGVMKCLPTYATPCRARPIPLPNPRMAPTFLATPCTLMVACTWPLELKADTNQLGGPAT